MRKITQEELKEILELHRQWIDNNNTGKQADLSNTDLRGVDLSNTDLSYANLSYSNLYGSSLRGATLTGANLSRTDLRRVNLSHVNLEGSDLTCANLEDSDLTGADLWGSDLTCADLRESDLTCADLRESCLSCANLTGVNLSGVDLYWTNLIRVNLSHANLTGATLYHAYLSGVQNINTVIIDSETKFLNNQCPKEGEFIGWKKCCRILYGNSGSMIGGNEYIVKLLIPSDSKRSSATTEKCRCSKAKVLSIYDMNGKEITDKEFEVCSTHDENFKYKIGQTVMPDKFEEDWWEECSNGIHFFMERELAEKY